MAVFSFLYSIFYDTMPFMKQDELIQSLLDKMHAMFDKAIGPNNRSEYMRQHNVSSKSFF